jgi:hypothetical protein
VLACCCLWAAHSDRNDRRCGPPQAVHARHGRRDALGVGGREDAPTSPPTWVAGAQARPWARARMSTWEQMQVHPTGPRIAVRPRSAPVAADSPSRRRWDRRLHQLRLARGLRRIWRRCRVLADIRTARIAQPCPSQLTCPLVATEPRSRRHRCGNKSACTDDEGARNPICKHVPLHRAEGPRGRFIE